MGSIQEGSGSMHSADSVLDSECEQSLREMHFCVNPKSLTYKASANWFPPNRGGRKSEISSISWVEVTNGLQRPNLMYISVRVQVCKMAEAWGDVLLQLLSAKSKPRSRKDKCFVTSPVGCDQVNRTETATCFKVWSTKRFILYDQGMVVNKSRPCVTGW